MVCIERIKKVENLIVDAYGVFLIVLVIKMAERTFLLFQEERRLLELDILNRTLRGCSGDYVCGKSIAEKASLFYPASISLRYFMRTFFAMWDFTTEPREIYNKALSEDFKTCFTRADRDLIFNSYSQEFLVDLKIEQRLNKYLAEGIYDRTTVKRGLYLIK